MLYLRSARENNGAARYTRYREKSDTSIPGRSGNRERNAPLSRLLALGDPRGPYQVVFTPHAGEELTPTMQRGGPRFDIISLTFSSSESRRSANSFVSRRSINTPGSPSLQR